MKSVKVSEADGMVLDWLVAKCEGVVVVHRQWAYKTSRLLTKRSVDLGGGEVFYEPSSNWSQGGPIIEREEIDPCNYTSRRVSKVAALWLATKGVYDFKMMGPTPLIAAMRCYVASKLGEVVDVPEELLK